MRSNQKEKMILSFEMGNPTSFEYQLKQICLISTLIQSRLHHLLNVTHFFFTNATNHFLIFAPDLKTLSIVNSIPYRNDCLHRTTKTSFTLRVKSDGNSLMKNLAL